MDDQSNFLFVYGTLQPFFDNAFARYLRQYSRYIGEGTITGQLIDIGQYPGVLYEENGSTLTYGTVVELINQRSTVLTYLDDYEGVGNSYAQPTEYQRILIPVKINKQLIQSWTYVYNWPTDGCKIIESGDYYRYLLQSDQKMF